MNLFVYGTLRNTYDNPMAQLLRQQAVLIGHGYVPGRLFDLGWYPGATYEPDSPYRVWGDVFELTDESVLNQLDEYEGIEDHPDDEYARRNVPVQMNNEVVACQMYVFLKADGQQTLLESGNYLSKH
ncbi:gamma-glutamylcyclotransferase family protein [Fibrella forsythiae]|uniref:Gamma-glutamylcyclotransferase n=1 Tax=Fibrella forsythiae TaxID=2817061 RepID=A0ABS3JTM9_9BACT|nr:gamma-glutamylcyclotransferase family protein [Fibrella forsythiae]MBO0952741.1 gamma-glutamylcyclotransferase [Fibrella forsythiae]